MSRIKPLNPATCTHCGSKNTERFGYSKNARGSLWSCKSCHKPFVVKTLVLAKKS